MSYLLISRIDATRKEWIALGFVLVIILVMLCGIAMWAHNQDLKETAYCQSQGCPILTQDPTDSKLNPRPHLCQCSDGQTIPVPPYRGF